MIDMTHKTEIRKQAYSKIFRWQAKDEAAGGRVDGIVVLGGSVDADLSVAHRVPVVRTAADRIIAAAALARRYPEDRKSVV